MLSSRRRSSRSGLTRQRKLTPLHWAAQLEDRIHRVRERWARRHGRAATVIPYTGYGNTEWVRVLCRVLLTKPEKADSQTSRKHRGVRGWRSFTSVPIGEVHVEIGIGGKRIQVVADRGGVVDTRVPVRLAPGWHTAILRVRGAAPVEAPVQIIAPNTSFGVISDVDDTVMVTALPRPLLAGWNTFVSNEHARAPTPGMAVLLERLSRAHPGAPVIYLSTGAWNVAPTLTRFLSRNLYPPGPLLLTDWGPTHDRWFRSGREHKEAELRRLAREFPNIRWLLIGDDGQHDEEIYSEFVAGHPDSVAAIAIRELSTGQAVLAGGRSKADHAATPWVTARDGAGIAAGLADLELL